MCRLRLVLPPRATIWVRMVYTTRCGKTAGGVATPRRRHRGVLVTDGFRLGIYVFTDAEVLDFAAPYGVFSVARRFDPTLEVFFVAEALRPVQEEHLQGGVEPARRREHPVGRGGVDRKSTSLNY